MRVDLAKAILSKNEVSIFDEYTSVVDRNVAKI
jgi:ABC-type transport system involved in cytochrome bd biosynthesis fused ATPase/permease subunit